MYLMSTPPSFRMIKEVLRKNCGEVGNQGRSGTGIMVRTRQAVLDSPEFQELWDRDQAQDYLQAELRQRQTHRSNAPRPSRTDLSSPGPASLCRKADIRINEGGVDDYRHGDFQTLPIVEEGAAVLPDLLSDLQHRTQLTRRSLARILINSQRLLRLQAEPAVIHRNGR